MFQTTTTGPNLLLHIPPLDCSVEEAEIRSALEPVTGIAPLDFQMAVFADMGGSLPVIANGLRLLRFRG